MTIYETQLKTIEDMTTHLTSTKDHNHTPATDCYSPDDSCLSATFPDVYSTFLSSSPNWAINPLPHTTDPPPHPPHTTDPPWTVHLNDLPQQAINPPPQTMNPPQQASSHIPHQASDPPFQAASEPPHCTSRHTLRHALPLSL